MTIRSPICSVLGHVDHGKSSILDSIRRSNICGKEAGGITQAIGASIIPISTIQQVCGNLLDAFKDLSIPGLLFVDTPGHAAFTSLRKRGGNLADIAILVVSIMEGFKPQTIEAIEILRQTKTPFIIAANKIDLVPGWRSGDEKNILTALSKQTPETQTTFETKMYELVGQLHEHFEINAERFDRITDFTQNIAIVPTSAHSGEGIPNILMLIAGLSQKFMGDRLTLNEGSAKGSVMEVKEEKGLGQTLDVILYDGVLKKGDTIVIGGVDEAHVTKVKILLEPEPLMEMRDKKSKYKQMQNVSAATGVKIVAPDVDGVIAGMPLRSCTTEDLEEVKETIQDEVKEVLVQTDDEGVIIKADSLGSLEALSLLLREKEIPIIKASIGNVSKKDLIDAEAMREREPLFGAVLAFNVEDTSGNTNKDLAIITNPIIYKVIEDYEAWRTEQIKKQEREKLSGLVFPCKIELLQGYVFRQNNPAVVGAHILSGKLSSDAPLMKDGTVLTSVKQMQKENKSISEAVKDDEFALSMDGVTVGRQIEEGDILYSAVPEDDFRQLRDAKKLLSGEEIAILKEIAEIMRRENPVWGI